MIHASEFDQLKADFKNACNGMMGTPEEIDNLLSVIDQRCPRKGAERDCVSCMIDCISLSRECMPSVVIEALQVSEDFAGQRGSVDDLYQAIQRCWEALGEHPSTTTLVNPEVSAIRAVICLLYRQLHPDMADGFVDSMSFFLQQLNNVAPRWQEYEALVRKHFEYCLRP